MVDDRQAIVDALVRFAWLLDHRAWDRVGEVLAHDATAYGETGIDAIVTGSLRANLGGCGPSQHLLGNVQVEVEGDRASSITYARVFHQGAGERSALTWECMGEYHDRWSRTADGWRIVERRFDVTVTSGDMSVLQPG